MMKAILFAGAILCLNSSNSQSSQKTIWEGLMFFPAIQDILLSNWFVVELAFFIILLTITVLLLNYIDLSFVKTANATTIGVAQNSKWYLNLDEGVTLQAAHDIRAPLQLINLKLNQENVLKNDPVLLEAVSRMNAIANDLLAKSKINHTECKVIQTIQKIIEEKKFINKDSVDFKMESNVKELTSSVDSNQLSRMMSNLLNNAIEAKNSSIKILVKIELVNDKVIVKIKDNGIGIPQDKLSAIRIGKLSYGKKDGNGLGIKHAIEFLDSFGSKLEIDSIEGIGTIVSFSLPVSNVEYSEIIDLKEKLAILIEDEKYIRKFWEQSAKKKGIKLLSFDSIESYKQQFPQTNEDNVYFLDSHLKNDQIRGEEFAKQLHKEGAKNIYLVTGHEAAELPKQHSIKAILGKMPPWEN